MRSVRIAAPPGAPQMPRSLGYLLPLVVFSAFLTDTNFIPGIETHFGVFEIVCVATFALLVKHMIQMRLTLARHPLIDLAVLILLLATLSQVSIPLARWQWSLIDLSILVFFVLFLVFLYQLVRHYRISPRVILRWTTYSILVVGPWILYEGGQTGGSIQAVGPFRNRAHMGFYMLTAFWIALMYRAWPGAPRRDRWAAHLAMALSLYAVAISGRRSAYLALIVGLIGIGISFLVARQENKGVMIATALFLLGFVVVFYLYGERFFPRAIFFKERISMIGAAVTDALGSAEDVGATRGFVALQRQGAFRALRDKPLTGIGWGGFYRSPYSPTGHEMHSTPLRFLAELGLLGLGLYLAFMAYLLRNSLRLAARIRHSPYAGAYLVQALALWSLSLSYLYNRHVSERTFWLLLVLFMALERFAHLYLRVAQQHKTSRRGRTDAPLGGTLRPAEPAARAAGREGGAPALQPVPPRPATPSPGGTAR